tara:strand:+ start:320 stop:769 length:450 start_codon:yes stop_codon:yes gene_type:complete
MKLEVLRYKSADDFTLGALFELKEDGSREFMCYTLEDEHRDEKVMSETRIPAGEYEIKLRTVGGFNDRYSRRFKDIHKGMLWLQDVPNFKWVLIHCGNTDEHTAGCLLVGQTQQDNFIGKSTQAYFDIYPRIAEAVELGTVTINYIDYA